MTYTDTYAIGITIIIDGEEREYIGPCEIQETPSMTNKDPLPCPFCGGTDLATGSWYLDDEGETDCEIDAWECNTCKAGAPKRVWDQRNDTDGNVHRLDIPKVG